MKKTFALFLVLMLVVCLSLTAFAADYKTIVTVKIPANLPQYTFHYPATATLQYGKTDFQPIGEISVSDVQYCSAIDVSCSCTYLINVDENVWKLDMSWEPELGDSLRLYENGSSFPQTLSAKVEDWEYAVLGATYQANLDYVVTCTADNS